MTIAKRNGGRHYSINPFLQAQRRCSRRICHRRCALARPSCAFEENYTVGRDPAAARARQPKMESEAEGAHDFGSSLARAQVGGVSPRPPNRGRSCTLLGREPLLEAKALGLTGRWFAGDPAVSERRALPAPSPSTSVTQRDTRCFLNWASLRPTKHNQTTTEKNQYRSGRSK